PNRAIANLIRWQSETQGLGHPARVAQYQQITFDVSFQEIASTLCTGGTLVLLEEELRQDSAALLAWIARQRIERLFIPFVALQHLAESAAGLGAPPSLRDVVVAGEQLRITPAIRRFFGAGLCRVHNHYGPTETHVVTAHRLEGHPDSWEELAPIGTPVSAVRVHLLDPYGALVPPGIPGEVRVSGAGLARGYVGEPSRTAERFVEHPIHGRLYRTGDRARWRRDGTLVYLGRRDTQVKLRGFRVELGEIEAAMQRLPVVRDAAVIVHGDGLHRRLAAFVSPAGATDPAALHDAVLAHLRSELPGYMIPASVSVLAALPVTPSGKIDRRALQPPETTLVVGGRELETETERLLATLWCDLLGVSDVSATSEFFTLGGHSLLAMQLTARIRQLFQVEVPVRELFEAPTIAGLAKLIDAQRGLPALPPIKRLGDGALPLSFAQRRLWFLDQFEGPSAVYNLAATVQLEGELDLPALRRALRRLIERQHVLRYRFPAHDGKPTVALIDPYDPLDLTDLRTRPDRAAEAERLAAVHAAQPFNLARGPLLRLHLLQLGDRHYRLLFNIHHIISDNWSLRVLLRELDTLYRAEHDGGDIRLPALPVQYGDYAAWEQDWLAGDARACQLDYWKAQLADLPSLLELPTDRPRPRHRTYTGGLLRERLEPGAVHTLRQFNRAAGATSFMTLLAAFNLVLARHSGQSDICVGMPIANRRHLASHDLIGMFVNTLVLRTRLDDRRGFAGLVEQVRQACLDAYTNQDLPFDYLVEALQPERNLSISPLFQAMLVQQDAFESELRLSGLATRLLPSPLSLAKFDLTLYFEEAGEEIRLAWEYNADLFDEARIARLAGHFQQLLAAGLRTPEQPVATLPLLPAAERATLLRWADGPARMPGPLLTEAIAAQVARTPDRIAVRDGSAAFSYAELERRANQLAHWLRHRGVAPGDTVAICLPRSADVVVAILAVLKSRAAYLPLDPAYPRARLAFMAADAACRAVITTAALRAKLAETGEDACCLDLHASAIAQCPAEPPSLEPQPDDPVYVIYTSGSTGTPKGAAVTQRGFANLLHWYIRTLALSDADRVLAVSALGFDLTQKNLFAPLLVGGSVHMPDDAAFDPDALAATIASEGITCINCTPNTLFALLDRRSPRGFAELSSLRRVVLGGEPIPLARLRPWLDSPDCHARVLNTYGPTECTDIATSCWLESGAEDGQAALGRPIDNVRVLLLDANRQLVPPGVPGDLWIGGIGVGTGYRNRTDLNASAFAEQDIGDGPQRLYRTGDRAWWGAEGVLHYLGRTDDQIKLRGFRIELDEVAAAMRALPGVRDAAAALHESGGRARLLAYVTTDTPASFDGIEAALRERLPDHMVPAQFIRLDRLPLTPNGKVDRAALPEPEAAPVQAVSPPRGDTETRLSALWSRLLEVEQFDRNASFFELGGHSLLATQVIAGISDEFGVDLPLQALFEEPTLAGLAALVSTEQARRVPLLARQEAGGPLLLSSIQRQLWLLDQLEGGSLGYNMPAALDLAGPLDISALRAALADLVERHASLRMSFPSEDGQPLVHLIAPYDPLTVVDLSGVEDPVTEAEARSARHALRRFDLSTGPLFDQQLLILGPERHRLLFNMHHIVGDGWSIDLLIQEVAVLYRAHRHGTRAELEPSDLDYTDYSAWERQCLEAGVLEAEIAHWRDALAGA
ncbi:MAG: amino acid adenylation domain-containing protein, partial [Acetobacteraceae bacterium]|nr:amino acid adenylation domain-containing protein [Acetobacteraceae bacterium]